MNSIMAEAPRTAKVRFLIISDTHSQPLGPDVQGSDLAFRAPLPRADVLLHCGDITNYGDLDEYRASLATLKDIKAELKLVIAGNHDRTLDWKFWKTQRYPDEDEGDHARAVELWRGPEAAAAGVTYLDEGVHRFTLNSGARFSVYASPYQPAFCNWAFPYKRDEDRFNPPDSALEDVRNIAQSPVPDFPEVDVMMTHGPPLGFRDRTVHGAAVGCAHLLRAIHRARPRLSCFGHIHEGWGAEHLQWRQTHEDSDEDPVARTTRESVDREKTVAEMAAYIDGSASGDTPVNHGQSTLLVNAAIMNVMCRPTNAPWLVDLDIPAE